MMLQTFKRSGLWMFAIALLMAAQLALTLHTVDHQLGLDGGAASEHCTLCHAATAMAPAPTGELPTPTLRVLGSLPEAVPQSYIPATFVAGFRARAPPVSI